MTMLMMAISITALANAAAQYLWEVWTIVVVWDAYHKYDNDSQQQQHHSSSVLPSSSDSKAGKGSKKEPEPMTWQQQRPCSTVMKAPVPDTNEDDNEQR